MLTNSSKENISSSTQGFYGYSFPKKHVRFETPTKNKTNVMDPQIPRPKSDFQMPNYTQDHLGLSSLATRNDVTSFKDTRVPFKSNICNLPPRKFQNDTPLSSLPLKAISQNLPPQPSNELELSVLDYPFESLIRNNTMRHNHQSELNEREYFPNRKTEVSVSQLNSQKKILENDVPYSVVPSKTPLPTMHSEFLSHVSPGVLSTAACSKKEFSAEKPQENSAENFGFFTLPNSAGFLPKKNTQLQPVAGDVEFSKANLQSRKLKNNIKPALPEEEHLRCCSARLPESKNDAILSSRENFNSYQYYSRNNDRIQGYHENMQISQNNACKQGRQPRSNANPCCFAPNSDALEMYQNCCEQTVQRCSGRIPMGNLTNAKMESGPICNGLEVKRRAIEMRERNSQSPSTPNKDNDTQEPTVSDLYSIIQLQNQQLQTLQQRVDKLISVKETNRPNMTIQSSQDFVQQSHTVLNGAESNKLPQNTNVESLNMNCVEQNMHKISIGVMTSFEMVMSSNVVNTKSFVSPGKTSTATHKDGCIQTSLENLNINEQSNVHNKKSKPKESAGNFLDGIEHYKSSNEDILDMGSAVTSTKLMNAKTHDQREHQRHDMQEQDEYFVNFQEGNLVSEPIRNAPARIDEEPFAMGLTENDESEDEYSHPDVGWTFYNNVMNRVNHILQSPPNPTQGSKPNNENTRRVHDQIGTQQRKVISTKRVSITTPPMEKPAQFYQFPKPVSETSLHMTRLAAKYLTNHLISNTAESRPLQPLYPSANLPRVMYDGRNNMNEMSFATMQYMQRYHLLSVGNNPEQRTEGVLKEQPRPKPQFLKPAYKNPSRILDITALKQQPKLL